MSTETSDKPRAAKQPEAKFGPYAGGIGVAVWVNRIQTADGLRHTRSITLAPRRYRDPKTGEWKDSGSYRPSDIPILLVALQKAMEHVYTTPLPGDEEPPEQEASETDTPF